MAFTHLHVHSHYSLLRGLSTVQQIVRTAKKHNLESIALTDGPGLYGAIEFYAECQKAGIKPIIGLELPVKISHNDYLQLVILATNKQGYLNLIQLSSHALLDTSRLAHPYVTPDELLEWSSDLVFLISYHQPLTRQLLSTAKELIKKNLYLELQIHSESLGDKSKATASLGKELNIPLVAANTVLYIHPDDQEAQNILECVGQKIPLQSHHGSDEDLSFRSPEQMSSDFKDYPEALDNVSKIIERCDIKIELNKWEFPNYQLPEGTTADQLLKEKTYEGLSQKMEVTDNEKQRLDYELDIIKNKRYSTYFLVVADIINWARSQGIAITTRGSAAGSLVSYAIGITTINPLSYRLPFERFLNPYRPSLPDIDMDFGDLRREEVFNYVKEKYGSDHVAQIATFGTMQARAAVRDVGRVLSYSYSFCDKVAKLIPFGKQGFPMTIAKALNIVPELKDLYETNEEVTRLLNLAKKIEGLARHISVHAAGTVISANTLTNYVPLQLEAGGTNMITQYDMVAVEQAGLVKMDFLGIRNLTILEQAAKLAEVRHGTVIDVTNLPLDDKKTFEMLARGETMGLFQLNGSGMTKHLKDLKPTKIEDIMAMVALYRPGPMESIPDYIDRKHHSEKISYLDDRLKEILDASYGVMVYQDDVLLTAIHIAGYNWEEADKLRKAMGKKIPEEMAKQKDKFLKGCVEYGKLTSEKAEQLWKLIEPFAAYGFNKAHACSYGMVAYQTAYLKAHYPVEYMTAVMTAESGNLETIAEAVAECRRMNLIIKAPSVNHSTDSFHIEDNTETNTPEIWFGLTAVKNVGEGIVHAIVTEREQYGPYQNLTDFLNRVHDKDLNKKSMESLIKAGAFDDLPDTERQLLLANLDSILQYNRKLQEAKKIGQSSLFGQTSNVLPPLTLKPTIPAAPLTKASWEKELLGIYLSCHPLSGYEALLPPSAKPLHKLQEAGEGQLLLVAGIISSLQPIITKNNERMLFAKLSDQYGEVELVVFPKTLAMTADCWQTGAIILVEGKLSDKEGEQKILVNRAKRLPKEPPVKDQPKDPLRLTINQQPSPDLIQHLHSLLQQSPGKQPVHLLTAGKVIKTNYSILLTEKIRDGLIKLLGPESIQEQP
ncbi:MAG: DNA polymerase III subunit alpha [bacterium]